jgi:hypothetical protein
MKLNRKLQLFSLFILLFNPIYSRDAAQSSKISVIYNGKITSVLPASHRYWYRQFWMATSGGTQLEFTVSPPGKMPPNDIQQVLGVCNNQTYTNFFDSNNQFVFDLYPNCYAILVIVSTNPGYREVMFFGTDSATVSANANAYIQSFQPAVTP